MTTYSFVLLVKKLLAEKAPRLSRQARYFKSVFIVIPDYLFNQVSLILAVPARIPTNFRDIYLTFRLAPETEIFVRYS